ncbi:recombinase family protein [Staphylococcus saprophyticus]|uniref:recombinase family protein n=1 Tax=Staphylococcus saprophyticus TaxID=29385 RepID=UPI000852B68F|nr:recombinase family protein [Staphylococcus saprophyticus]ASE57727.1 transposon DNA-invertase [Staphylococcus saprophyticus]MDW3891091.1 recombinase family protein [Staphylococcus saprophyticus]MDW3903407.1 recombinase family protein [Staphylococcus saprophyticus]MDW3908458.1 recombinase family protein [Staphylococcus saprophyticus]MDW3913411.1 recombinase family protein [Staphylococcus saprophyticus]
MIIGYARVSTIDQNLDRQIKNLQSFGAEKIFTEKQSGKSVENRPIFQEVLNFLRMGDRLIIESLDRLGRNYDEIIQTVNYLKEKEAQLMITSLPMMNEVIGNPLLDKFMKDLIIQILAMISEQERNESKRRQAQGIKIAKEKGVYKGRPLLYSPNAKNPHKRIVYHRVIELLDKGESISKIAKDVGITRQTIYRIKKGRPNYKFIE